MPTIPPATIDNTLEVQGEEIAAKESQSRLLVDVEIVGRGPFRFMVDSGADRTVIGASLARQLELPPGGQVMLHSTSGASTVDTVKIDRLRIGTSERRRIVAPALPERFIGAQGLLGIDALADQRLLLDFDRKRITIQDTRAPPPALASDEIVVTARRRNGQLILTEASVGSVPILAVIDSGSEVTMGNSALRTRIFAGRHPNTQTIDVVSVTGDKIVADLLILRELRIGGIIMQNVPMAFNDSPPFALFGLSKQPAILLGSDVLQAFRRVSLDFRARKVRFSLRY